MIKNTLSLFALAGALLLASCSSQPSDLRPELKVSTDSVPPGMRNNTANIDNARNEDAVTRPDVLINHDEHENKTQPGTEKGTRSTQKSVEKEAVENNAAGDLHQ
ncbi:hypothetical protein [Rufibacter tibetensis]|uniref:Lipoprotein n=1 Tax=Rufibacter tibetensis TaxID=512763 RepID=A0A0P0CWT7_9BACT|nr:hypothetical protein [Rufibacter tibetensis]ALI99071.1 hypothetical protein DC20_08895 [Rufibacter tibetensis]